MASVVFDRIIEFLINGVTAASTWQILVYTLAVTHITIAGVTIYLHRSQAHRALDLHPIASHFFRFWIWLTSGMVTKEWAAIHRKHHAKCDTEEDPHSPVTRGIRKVLLQGSELYRAESKNLETLQKYGYGTPDDWIERHLYSRHSWLGIGLMLGIDVLLFGVIGVSVWAVQMLWIPITAAGIINGIGHYWGYRNYDCADAATNVFPIGILIGGEELHNNHHTFGTSAKLSSKWYEFDIGWMYIRMMEAVGLAKVKKVSPVPKFDSAKQVADFETLQSVIANRHDVMAKFAKSVKHIWHAELESLAQKSMVEARLLKSSRKLLRRAPDNLDGPYKEQLSQLFAHSSALQTIHEMRAELAVLWGRSHFSREQLLLQLQEWCARAEASGIHALSQFSQRLRSYC